MWDVYALLNKVFNSKTLAFEQLTITNATAVSLTPAKYSGCFGALITVDSGSIRFRADGTAPTATVGHIANAGDQIELESDEDMQKFKAISTTGAVNAVINISYFN